MLLMDPGHPVSVDRMVTEVWGEAPDPGAVASLYTHVSNLRRVLGKERILRDAAGYRLELAEGDEVDSQLFEVAAGCARRMVGTDAVAAVPQFDTALGLWRGSPFEGQEDIAALAPEIVRLSELQTSVEVDRFEAILRSGESPPVGEVEELCDRRPLDERPWALLMRTLYREGRQAEALRTYRGVRELLGKELGVEPSPRLMRLEEQILLHDPELDPSPAGTPSNLPTYRTAFVGRMDERAHLIAALESHRMVTVIGPGGVGKTRLAVEVASSLTGDFTEGIWLVDLARVADEAGVGAAIAAEVHASGGAAGSASTAAAALSGRHSLLVLDNCEHVVIAVREAAETMLDTAPDLVILATSRVPLGLGGECRIGLDGLPAMNADGTPGDAVTLFLDRAQSIGSTLTSGDTNAASVEAICRRLDGMPLALELAAARSDVLSAPEIVDLLTRRFAVLVDGSQDRDIHRSLEATVGWSYGLLEPDQRVMFAELGAFEGPFTVEAARVVLDLEEPEDAITAIERLVNASLVKVETQSEGSTSYRLLDTLRVYARQRLTDSGMWGAVANRHDQYYVGMCRALSHELLVRGRPGALEKIARSVEDLTAAWDRMSAEDPADVLPIAWALGNHWLARGGIAEGEVRIRDLLARTVGVETHWRMLALTIGAWVADRRGSTEAALTWSDEALALADVLGSSLDVVVALNHGGQLRVDRGDHEGAIRMLRRSLDELARGEKESGSLQGIADGRAWALLSMNEARRWSGETDPAIRDQLYEVRKHFLGIGDPEGQVRADRVLVTMQDLPMEERRRLGREMMELAGLVGGGHLRYEAARAMTIVSWDAGDRDDAMAMNRAAVRSAIAGGSLTDLGSGLLYAGMLAAFEADAELAARLIGAGWRFCGTRPGPYMPHSLETVTDALRGDLGSDRFEDLVRIGSSMAPGEAASLVLSS